jgi:hypothetical protein
MRLLLLLCLCFSFSSWAQTPPPTDPGIVTIDSQASVVGSRTVCPTMAATTAVNLWTLLPTELKSNILPMLRYVTVQNVTASATPFATNFLSTQVGGSAPTGNVGVRVFSGAAWQPQIRRPNNNAVFNGTFPSGPIALWIYPSHATDVCITWYW